MERFGIKKKRLERSVQQIISEMILFEVNDPRISEARVSLTRVETNDELDRATVFFTCNAEGNKNKVVKALYKAGPFFLSRLKEKIKIRYLPKLRFIYDQDLNEAEDVVSLIDRLKKEEQRESDNTENN